MDGWIKLHRKLLDWQWYDDTNIVRVFLHLLLKANFETRDWHDTSIERGQLVTSIKNLAAETHLSAMQIRRALTQLQKTKEIIIETTNKYTMITICNYAKYQCFDSSEQQTNNNQITNKQQTNNNQTTTTKEIKNIKKEKNVGNIKADNENFDFEENENKNNGTINEKKEKEKSCAKKEKEPKHKYGQFENVLLTDKEAEKLHIEYGDSAVGIVEYLSAYKVEKDYKTKSDYLTIKRWVADAYNKQSKTNSNGNTNNQISMQRIFEASEAMREYEQQLFSRS